MIRALSSIVASGMIIATFGQASAVFAADDDKALAGAWRVVSSTSDGEERALPVDPIFTFSKGKVVQSMTGVPGAPDAGRVQRNTLSTKLDPEKSPKQIDMTYPGDPQTKSYTQPGIYKIEGNKLTLGFASFTFPDSRQSNAKQPVTVKMGDRPESFDGKNGELYILEREKK